MKSYLNIGAMAALLFTSACTTLPEKSDTTETTATEQPIAPVETEASVPDPMPESTPESAPDLITITPPEKQPCPPEISQIIELPDLRPLPEIAPPVPPPVMEDTPKLAPKPVLTVNLDGLKTLKGVVAAALYDEAGYKAKDADPIAAQNIPVTSMTLSFTFDNIPAGDYGLKLYHDVDENGALNTNVFGIPSEPYAFSNSALWPFGEAKWKDAKFTVGEDGTTQDIRFK